MQNVYDSDVEVKNNGRKIASIVRTVLFCAACAICVLLAVIFACFATSKTPENTLEVFGYKVYCAENDIEDIGIRAGSLVVVRNTNTDDYYTHQSLSQNVVLSIDKLGFALKYNSLWMVLCITVPIMLFFTLNLVSALKKLPIERQEKRAIRKDSENSDLDENFSQQECQTVQ